MQLKQYLEGFYRIEISGSSVERFLNLAANRGLFIWGIERKINRIYLNISESDYQKIGPLLEKTDTKAVLLSENGLPFLIRYGKKYLLFISCAAVCIFTLLAAGLFMWDVEYQGNCEITSDQLNRYLANKDIRLPMLMKSIDSEKLAEKIREDFDTATWVSVSKQGTTLKIDLHENEMKEYEKEESGCKDLVASMDGRIVRMVTRTGNPLVGVGDDVKKNDVLVSGQIDVLSEDQTIKDVFYCIADADIYLETDLKKSWGIAAKEIRKKYTEKERTFPWISVGELEFSPVSFLNPKTEKEIIKIYKNSNSLIVNKLPVQYGFYKVRTYVKEYKKLSEAELNKKWNKELTYFVKTLTEKGVQIKEKDVKIEKNDSNWDIVAIFRIWHKETTLRTPDILNDSVITD